MSIPSFSVLRPSSIGPQYIYTHKVYTIYARAHSCHRDGIQINFINRLLVHCRFDHKCIGSVTCLCHKIKPFAGLRCPLNFQISISGCWRALHNQRLWHFDHPSLRRIMLARAWLDQFLARFTLTPRSSEPERKTHGSDRSKGYAVPP